MFDSLSLPIGEVARRANVATSAIRYYEEIGLLPPAERESGQRRYDEGVVRRLDMIAVAQRAGFSLREIAELMPSFDADADMGTLMHTLAEEKLAEVEQMLERAEAMKTWLSVAADCTCGSPDECSLFEAAGEGEALRVVQVEGGCRKA
jgi:MerR family redox-sensitive transcriptional activator SoxR